MQKDSLNFTYLSTVLSYNFCSGKNMLNAVNPNPLPTPMTSRVDY